jgi:hypothetical protein
MPSFDITRPVDLSSYPTNTPIAADALAVALNAISDNARLRTTVALTAAQIIAMGTTPVVIIAAPGANKIIIVDGITFEMTRTGTAFTGGGAVEFRYTDASGAKVSADIAATVITTGGAGVEYNRVGGLVSSFTPVVNAAIVIRNATAAFAAGTGTARLFLRYHILDVS